MSPDTIDTILSRRVTRYFQDKAIPEEHLWTILKGGRWAPAASNIRLHRFICITDPIHIEQLQMVSPGIAGSPRPAAIIVICVDRNLAAFDAINKNYHEYIDAGTSTQNMLLMAHALGIGACPATLDSPSAVQTLLNTPPGWEPEMFVLLGYATQAPPRVRERSRKKITVEDLVQWGPFPEQEQQISSKQ